MCTHEHHAQDSAGDCRAREEKTVYECVIVCVKIAVAM